MSPNLIPHIPLYSPRLTLNPLELSDIPTLYTLSSRDHNNGIDVFAYIPYGPFTTLTEWETFANATFLNDPSVSSYVIHLRTSSGTKPIGHIAYLNITPVHHRVEIGHIWISPQPHLSGKGYGREAAALLTTYAIDRLNYMRVEWKTHHANIASQRTATALGFKHEGVFRRHMYYKGGWRDSFWYSCVNDGGEWEDVRKRFVERGWVLECG